MTQQVTSETQAKDPGELEEKLTPMSMADEFLVSEDGINVKRMKEHLVDPLRGSFLINTGFI